MTDQKFQEEVQTLQEFIKCYCQNKHPQAIQKELLFSDHLMELHITLCEECSKTLLYSLDRLQQCPYEEKPKCRKCSTPCYEKDQWKRLAKIMRYSGLKLGFIEIKRKLFKQ